MEDRLVDLQKELAIIPCQICHHTEWDIFYRCDLEFGGCLYEAKCRSCGYAMEVTEGAEAVMHREPDLRAKAKGVRCPHCGSQTVSLTYKCDMKPKDCYYVGECSDCHRHFKMNGNVQPIP